MKEMIKHIPILGSLARRIYWRLTVRERKPAQFAGSAAYWERRYSSGGDSGVGSYAQFAEFKADVLNAFVSAHQVQTIIEFGCGDGNQLALAGYPAYLGFDVSASAISKCRERFKSDPQKSFRLMNEYNGETADLTLSLDVIYHLVEDEVYVRYMQTLFNGAGRYVIIYASDFDEEQNRDGLHIRHRKFSRWVDENLSNWKLVDHLLNRYPYGGDYRKGSFAEFFIYEKVRRNPGSPVSVEA